MRPFLDNDDGTFLGYIHIQHKTVINSRLILNSGSVGQSHTGTEAEYAVVDTETKETDVQSTEYDIQEVVEKIRKVGLPEEIAERLEA